MYYFLPLEKGCCPFIKQNWILLSHGYFVPSLVEIGPVVLEKKMKMWKVYRQTDGRTQTTDDRWSEKLTWAFSSGELKTECINCWEMHFTVTLYTFHSSYCAQVLIMDDLSSMICDSWKDYMYGEHNTSPSGQGRWRRETVVTKTCTRDDRRRLGMTVGVQGMTERG